MNLARDLPIASRLKVQCMNSVPFAPLLAGVGIGLAVAVPIGPMGVLCIQRTIAFGLVAGFATGLGAATVHLAFGSIAAVGLGAAATSWLGAGAQAVAFASAGLLFWFAARIWQRTTVAGSRQVERESWARSYGSALLFGLSNPLTLVLFAAAMPALAAIEDPQSTPLLVGGVFLGSIAWWTALSTTVSLVRGRLSGQAIATVNRLSSLTLAGLGALMLTRALS
jgi:threonine/homoserine/homoserine lactone efflux protein